MLRGSCEIRIWVIWTQSQHSFHSCAASQIQTQAGLKFHLYKFINFIPFSLVFPFLGKEEMNHLSQKLMPILS